MKLTAASYIIALLISGLTGLQAQKYNIRQFGPPDLPDKVIYSLNQDPYGFLWVGTGKGLFTFDGYRFRLRSFPDSSETRFATVIFRDSRGTMWVGGSDGTVHYSVERSGLIMLEGIDTLTQRINDIREGPDGDIYILSQNLGFYKVAPTGPKSVTHLKVPERQLLFSFCFASDETLLAGSGDELLVMRVEDDTIVQESVTTGIEYTRITSIEKAGQDDSFYTGTGDNGLFFVTRAAGGYVASPVFEDENLRYLRIQSIFTDSDSNLWLSTYGSGILKLLPGSEGRDILNIRTFNQNTGLSGDDARAVFQDNEGNIWMALYGMGLNQLVSEAFTFFQPGSGRDENNIVSVFSTGQDRILAGTPAGYHVFDLNEGRSVRFESVAGATSRVPATAYFPGKDGRVWIGTAGAGLFMKDGTEPVRQFYRSLNAGENFITSIALEGDHIWLSTRNGVLVLNSRSGQLLKKFSTLDRLPHNYVNQVYIDRDGNKLVATEALNIYYADIEEGITPGHLDISGSIRNVMQGYTQAGNGGYWIATLGNGVFFFSGDSARAINTNDGLLSNFCYSVLADSDSRLWVGHEKGFSRFDPNTGNVTVFSTSFAGGGDCNPNAIASSDEGMVFIGTTNGLVVYDRRKDLRDVIPPLNNIVSITVNDKVYPYTPELQLPYNRYVVKIDYVGISLSNPDLVRYRTKLGNYDIGWSDPGTQRQVTYRLTDGVYKFSIESVNESGLSALRESVFTIVVKRPFWRAWWFVLLLVSGIAALVAAIIRIRDARQRKMREHLEDELGERTREVVRQKEEIEQQNIEITDSINYARRIQASILPDIARLKETFDDTFIIFLPRDIVSGDFYWFERFDEERFILVCADSTGHGVPGAFMSMIGSTLLQDIVSRKNITRPSEILSTLDKQIFSTLNRNLDVGVSNDGMDMVVCEFNLKSRQVRLSSAMRPVILIMGGETIYIKGNRSSVGGAAYSEKFFDDQEYYLSEGDSIYLFSDGFPDQFGGEDGRKMKVARLKKLIENISNMTMEEQREYISNFFFDWKGDHEQVDDILFMGIRF
ncbi:MAG: hypothetical protein FJY11_01320 [Bacteroidetes bacterium]|nr:hypothetical protein [Bacteroidota bacterium]